MSQLTFEGSVLHEEVARDSYSFIEHGVSPGEVDGLIAAYASFTDELPDPSLDTVNQMITNPDKLDDIDRTKNPCEPWMPKYWWVLARYSVPLSGEKSGQEANTPINHKIAVIREAQKP